MTTQTTKAPKNKHRFHNGPRRLQEQVEKQMAEQAAKTKENLK